MHILLLFIIYASHFFTFLAGITHTFSRSDLQMRMLCMYHHSTLLIIAHCTAYRIDYPQSSTYEKSTRATGITPRNHNTNTAMFGDLLRYLSACFIPHMPAHFRPYFTLFTVIFPFVGSTVHRTTAATFRYYYIYAPDILHSYTVFYTACIRPLEIAQIFHS